MKTLTTQELHERLESGPVAIFDVRGDIKYEIGHIPGAKTAPLGSLVFRVASIMNPDSFIVVYSAGGDCTLAAQAVDRLENLRLKNVHCYEGGVKEWTAAGFDIVESPHPRLVTRGPVVECRSVIVDRETAYGGVFKTASTSVEGAGG
jgi:rhodanese-related sulfurtransferase